MAQAARITTHLELDRALEASREGPVLIFKHSCACGISAIALQTYNDFLADRSSGDGILYTLIEIQDARDVSTELARRTGVRHESPQAMLVRDGQAVWTASHWDISRESLGEALAAV